MKNKYSIDDKMMMKGLIFLLFGILVLAMCVSIMIVDTANVINQFGFYLVLFCGVATTSTGCFYLFNSTRNK